MIYDVIDKVSGEIKFDYVADAPVAWAGLGFDLYDHVPRAEAPAVQVTRFNGRRLLTKLEFRSLFPETAIKAIDRFEAQFEQVAFLNEDQKDSIRTSFNDYHEANDVNLDDPRWVPGLSLYVALGMMTEVEMLGVLNG